MKKAMLGAMGLLAAGCLAQPDMPPKPTAEMAAAGGTTVETLERGRAVYVTDCARCHEAMMPEDVSKEDWHVILPGMAWNSGISAADEKAVEAYILAVKAQ